MDEIETENRYGCTPCPECGSEYRVPYIRDGERVEECDECGHEKEPDLASENFTKK